MRFKMILRSKQALLAGAAFCTAALSCRSRRTANPRSPCTPKERGKRASARKKNKRPSRPHQHRRRPRRHRHRRPSPRRRPAFDAAIAPEEPAAPPPVAAPPIAFADGAPTPAAFDAPAPPAAAFDAPPPAPSTPMTPAAAPFDEDLKSLIVDEPGKLFGQTADEQLFGSRPKGAPAPKMRAKPRPSGRRRRLEVAAAAWSCRTSAAWRRSGRAAGGPDGLLRLRRRRHRQEGGLRGHARRGHLVACTINSPFFERAAPPPAVTAVQAEHASTSRP